MNTRFEPEPRAWEIWRSGAGSADSYTTLTRLKSDADQAKASGAVVTPLYAKTAGVDWLKANDVIGRLKAMKLALESDVDRRDFDLLAETAIHTMDVLDEAASLIKKTDNG